MLYLFNTNIITNPTHILHLFTTLFTEFSSIIINVLKCTCNIISLLLYIL
jgi:hypothetical protein